VRSLRRNGTSTLADLAGAVGTSRRTVLRDIGALRDQGFDVFALLISVASMRAAGSLPFSATPCTVRGSRSPGS